MHICDIAPVLVPERLSDAQRARALHLRHLIQEILQRFLRYRFHGRFQQPLRNAKPYYDGVETRLQHLIFATAAAGLSVRASNQARQAEGEARTGGLPVLPVRYY